MNPKFPAVVLSPGKEKSLNRFHRWVFSGAIQSDTSGLTDGEIVEVLDHQGEYLATGIYQDGSIAVRILTFTRSSLDQAFWNQSIEEAVNLRKELGFFSDPSTNCFRLVHAEGDGLPGLIVDWFNGTVVVQVHTSGIKKMIPFILEALICTLSDQLAAVLYRSAMQEEMEVVDCLYGKIISDEIRENGLKFKIDLLKGQKTGYFIDQRDNRRLLRDMSGGKKILDAFSYAGGFAANALSGGAAFTDVVDGSEAANKLAETNLELNGFKGRFNIVNEDVNRYLQVTSAEYDIIVVDPPAYAKHLSSRHKAIKGYKRLNINALNKIRSGGLLFTFSCSQVVDKTLFENTVMSAFIESGRPGRILYRLGQPADHPVNIFHPESEYLKGLVIRVG